MARGRGRGRGRGRVRSEKDLSADEGTTSSDDEAGDALGEIDLILPFFVLFFFGSALVAFFLNTSPIDGEISRAVLYACAQELDKNLQKGKSGNKISTSSIVRRR